MADLGTGEYYDLRSRRSQHENAQPEHSSTSAESSQDAVTYPHELLRSLNLRGHGNGPVRASMMQQAQRIYGNRAVQRFIHRDSGSTIPVQRFPGGDFDLSPRCPLFGPALPLGCKPWGSGGGGGGGEPAKPVPQPGKKEKKKPVKAKPPAPPPKKGRKLPEGENGGGGGYPWLLPPLGKDRQWPYGGGILGGY